MEDRGFLISDYLENIWALVIYQLFLKSSEQITKAEVKEIQAIVSVTIY